jgi:hypothetical protein
MTGPAKRVLSLLVLLLAPALSPVPVAAQGSAPAAEGAGMAEVQARRVAEALLLPGIIDVLSREGIAQGEDMAGQLFGPGPVPADWTALVARVHDPAAMEQALVSSLARELEGRDAAAMATFFETEPGRSLVALELAAREAMLDEDVEMAAKEAAAVAMAAGEPRLDLLRRYIDAADVIDSNVASAMNANHAYLMALLDGGALGDGMTADDVTGDIWSQEAQIRADTTEWVHAFLLTAYGPASDADIEALIAFTESAPGRELTRALNAAFDRLYMDISRALGLAAARYMTTRQI